MFVIVAIFVLLLDGKRVENESCKNKIQTLKMNVSASVIKANHIPRDVIDSNNDQANE